MTSTTPGSVVKPRRALSKARVGSGPNRRRGMGPEVVRVRATLGLPARGLFGRMWTRPRTRLRKAQGGRKQRELGIRKSTAKRLASERNKIVRQGRGSGTRRVVKPRGTRRTRKGPAHLGGADPFTTLGSRALGQRTSLVRRVTVGLVGKRTMDGRTGDHGRRRRGCLRLGDPRSPMRSKRLSPEWMCQQ
jgi:hypothetical protein